MELEPLTVDELKTTGYAQNILRKFECLISQGENALQNLWVSHYSRFFEHYLFVFASVKSKFEKTSISEKVCA